MFVRFHSVKFKVVIYCNCYMFHDLFSPLLDPANIEQLDKDVDVNTKLGYVFDALTLTRHKLNGNVPLIGFSGAPWTLMSYMIEG